MPHIKAVKRRASPKTFLCALASLLLLPGRALAWGSEGHHIIADIAEQYSSPQRRNESTSCLRVRM